VRVGVRVRVRMRSRARARNASRIIIRLMKLTRAFPDGQNWRSSVGTIGIGIEIIKIGIKIKIGIIFQQTLEKEAQAHVHAHAHAEDLPNKSKRTIKYPAGAGKRKYYPYPYLHHPDHPLYHSCSKKMPLDGQLPILQVCTVHPHSYIGNGYYSKSWKSMNCTYRRFKIVCNPIIRGGGVAF